MSYLPVFIIIVRATFAAMLAHSESGPSDLIFSLYFLVELLLLPFPQYQFGFVICSNYDRA